MGWGQELSFYKKINCLKQKILRISRSRVMSGSQVAVLLCTTFFAVESSILLVACRSSGTFFTGVVAAGAARPAVVVRGDAVGLDACSAEFLSKVGGGNMKFSEVLQGNEELGLGGSAVCG